MTTVSQIQAGIQARLDTITSLTGRTYAYWPEQVNPPSAWVWFPSIPSYHEAMGMGLLVYDFPVHVAVGKQVDRAGQSVLEALASPAGVTTSIRAAIEADQTLGGIVSQSVVVDFRAFSMEEAQTLSMYGGVWTVRVYAPGV